jgi:ligand-binding SRPBCC domain-containing protein
MNKGFYQIMETIRLQTWIDAPMERCFLLSLSIDLHLASTSRMREQAIDGVTTGLIGEGQSVTFRARHLGRWWRHTSRIEALRPYSYFRDVMVAGAFRRFEHEHHFAPMDDGTRMRDEIQFSAPWGAPGRILARRLLVELMRERNAHIKHVAESEEWRNYLDGSVEMRLSLPAGGSARRWDPKGLLKNSGIIVPPPRA